MAGTSRKDIEKKIQFYKDKITYNALCKDMNTYTREQIEKFSNYPIPAQALIKYQLVHFMKNIGVRFSRLKKETDVVANRWQHQVDTWLKENNLTEQRYLEEISVDKKSPTGEKPMNGAWKSNQRNSVSDYRQNSQSSSSQEVESPDSQRHNQRNSNSNHRQPFSRKSSSPLQPENLPPRHRNTAEFNANLSIDPREVTSSNAAYPAPTRANPYDSYQLAMQEGMFKAVRLDRPLPRRGLELFQSLCERMNIPLKHYPKFLIDYRESRMRNQENLDSSNSRMRNQENLDSSNSRMRNQENLDSSNSVNRRTNRQIDPRDLPSTSRQSAIESSSCESQHERKRKHMENTQPVANAKKLKVEQQPAQDSKLKQISRTQNCVKGKDSSVELQSSHSRMLKHKETSSGAKAKEDQRPIDSKLNLDAKRVCITAQEAKNCTKNSNRKRELPNESAMIAITSSKKERTSVYHGGKKENNEILKLKHICENWFIKVFKQCSDATKYINKNAKFDDLESVLVRIAPEKLYKLEEEKPYLLENTDPIWEMHCKQKYKSRINQKTSNETWRIFYRRLCAESDQKLKNLTASISASASKGKPDRQIKFTDVEGSLTKRQRIDQHAIIPKKNGIHSAVKPLPIPIHPSNSRPVEVVPPKGISNHVKPGHRTIRKDAPLMHKAKKTMGQLNRFRN